MRLIAKQITVNSEQKFTQYQGISVNRSLFTVYCYTLHEVPMATLYRKYRPQTFGDLVGQDHIRQTLQSALKQERVAHAYLFSGPRGTGKTSVARLLAKAINCLQLTANGLPLTATKEKDHKPTEPKAVVSEQSAAFEPCNECQMCIETTEGRSLDVIEIDAASNRGIDEMRDLREKIKFAPTQARKKVYIIDEVHMLTKEAFNALLKTLEEPPAHAVFVLATTEIHKVPVTISSRCQTFVFKKASLDDLTARLTWVAKAEAISIEPEAVAFLARLAGGSYRDALSLLDQVASFYGDTLTLEAVQNLLGLASEDRLLTLLESLVSGEAESALAQLQQLESDGIDPEQFANQLVDAARSLVHIRLRVPGLAAIITTEQQQRWQTLAERWSDHQLLDLIRDLIGARQMMKQAAQPLLPLEVVIIKTARLFSVGRAPVAPPTPAPQKVASQEVVVEIVEEEPEILDAAPVMEQVPQVSGEPISIIPSGDHTHAWKSLLERLRAEHMSIHALLQQAEFGGIENEKLIVRVPFQFAADRLSDKKHRKVIEQALEDIIGSPLALVCTVQGGDVGKPTVVADGPLLPDVIDAALEMFGSDDAKPN